MERLTIMIAEDQKLFRDGIKDLLSGFNIIAIGEAGNGIELLSLLKTSVPDVILLDIEMPEMNGGQTLNILTRDHPDLKVIMISQYDDGAITEEFIARGARGYITKNTDLEDMVTIIRSVKNHGYCTSNLPKTNHLFTNRETEIIPLICDGKTNEEIATELNIVVKTVEAHRNRIYQKTNSKSIADFLKYAIRRGLNYLENPKKTQSFN